MATIKTDFVVDYEEIIELLKDKYPFLENSNEDTLINIKEEGNFDRGDYKIRLKNIIFKVEKQV